MYIYKTFFTCNDDIFPNFQVIPDSGWVLDLDNGPTGCLGLQFRLGLAGNEKECTVIEHGGS